MSDAVVVAIITSVANLLVVVLGRWMSHREHKASAKQLSHIGNLLNGK